MKTSYEDYRASVRRLADQWLADGLPSRQGLDQAADELVRLRGQLGVEGMWPQAPTMVTATLDDGLGQGMAIIARFAGSIGIQLIPLGLMQPPATIIDACRRHQPAFLGLTILHFDSEDDLATIARRLPRTTRLIAGGPVFAGDPDLARRTGIHFAARNVAAFLKYMVDASTTVEP